MIKIYGKNLIYEALISKAPIKNIFLTDVIAKKDKDVIRLIHENNLKYEIYSKEKMNNEFGSQNQGYGALREDYYTYDLSYLKELTTNSGRVLILDGIQDPHNFGAVLRSVDAFGYDLVILPNNRSVKITGVVAHVSTGAIEHTKIMYVDSLLQVVKILKDRGYWICGTDALGDKLTSEIDKTLNLALIIGSEGFGMSKTLINQTDFLIKIPMVGHVNSLNASVSAGIVLSELMALKK